MNAEAVEKLAHFRIVGKLGEGGMGIVYKAFDEKLERTIALKILRPDFATDPERRKRFLREARLAASVTHPNIATVYEVGESDGCAFIAMELLEGMSLRRRLADGALPIPEALALARGIARGLQRAHDKGMVHRDLKPDNVMIVDGEAKVLDFGLARTTDSEAPVASDEETASRLTEEGQILGTPGYMSPEQAAGKVLDRRTDLFSFGVMLYEMVTGTRPFRGSSSMEVVIALSRDEAPAPSSVNPRVPPEVDRLIATCLAKQPKDRYSTAQDLLRDLDHALGESGSRTPAPSSTPSAPATAPAPAQRSPRIAVAAVALAAIAAGALLWARTRPSAPPAVDAPRAIRSIDLPPPPGKPEAVAAFRQGMQLFRDGSTEQAIAEYHRAVALDPSLAAAHLRLALLATRGHPAEARAELERASALQSVLSEHDQALLDALRPCVQNDSFDHAACATRFQAAVDRFPNDSELARCLGEFLFDAGRLEEGLSTLQRGLVLDPGDGDMLSATGYMQAYLGRRTDALSSWERCTERAPGAVFCLLYKMELFADEGRCDDVEPIARRITSISPNGVIGPDALANVQAAKGPSLEAARETMRQASSHVPESFRPLFEASVDTTLAILSGDFVTAEQKARTVEAAVADLPEEEPHAISARVLAAIYLETGRDKLAAEVADRFLSRRDAWIRDPRGDDFAINRDPTPFLLMAQLRAGTRTRASFDRAIEDYVAGWKKRAVPFYARYLWMHGFAAVTETEEEARAALAAAPRFDPLPPFWPQTHGEAFIGRTYLLAGRTDDALPYLERAAHHCRPLRFPFSSTRAHAWLAEAYERKGDAPRACQEHRAVLARWGNAKPASLTANRSRAALSRLHCP